MKITELNYEEFYFGTACECYIQGELYALGYEALKATPDIGYDLLVTNCARTRFLNEEPRQYNVQIKGRVCSEKNVTFKINKDDLVALLNDKNSVLILVFCRPNISLGRGNITIYRDIINFDNMLEDYLKQVFDEEQYPSFKSLKERNISYDGFSKEYMWFNNAHLHRLKEEGYFYEKEDKYCLQLGFSENSKYPINQFGERIKASELYAEYGGFSYELSKLDYLVNMSDDLLNGCMFEGDIYI